MVTDMAYSSTIAGTPTLKMQKARRHLNLGVTLVWSTPGTNDHLTAGPIQQPSRSS
jgi:hypothetical protein